MVQHYFLFFIFLVYDLFRERYVLGRAFQARSLWDLQVAALRLRFDRTQVVIASILSNRQRHLSKLDPVLYFLSCPYQEVILLGQ